jgi:hypothetical protein
MQQEGAVRPAGHLHPGHIAQRRHDGFGMRIVAGLDGDVAHGVLGVRANDVDGADVAPLITDRLQGLRQQAGPAVQMQAHGNGVARGHWISMVEWVRSSPPAQWWRSGQ